MAHASDWYLTLTEGYAGIPVNASQTGGPRPLDGFNLWPALTSLGPSPRNEVISQVIHAARCDWFMRGAFLRRSLSAHVQVNNTYFSEGVSVIRVGEMKLIRGPPGAPKPGAII